MRIARFLKIGILFSCCFPVGPLPAQNMEKALKEGEVVWYTPTAIEDSQKMIQGFEKKHPGIKVRLFRNRETSLLPRIINEKQAGRPIVDVRNEKIASISDVLVKYGSDEYPPVVGLV